MVVVAVLPERFLHRMGVDLSGTLFRSLDESMQIRSLRSTMHEQVRVVRHQAVRKNVELESLRGSQNLLNHH